MTLAPRGQRPPDCSCQGDEPNRSDTFFCYGCLVLMRDWFHKAWHQEQSSRLRVQPQPVRPFESGVQRNVIIPAYSSIAITGFPHARQSMTQKVLNTKGGTQ